LAVFIAKKFQFTYILYGWKVNEIRAPTEMPEIMVTVEGTSPADADAEDHGLGGDGDGQEVVVRGRPPRLSLQGM
jgi:hypothetical protein